MGRISESLNGIEKQIPEDGCLTIQEQTWWADDSLRFEHRRLSMFFTVTDRGDFLTLNVRYQRGSKLARWLNSSGYSCWYRGTHTEQEIVSLITQINEMNAMLYPGNK